MLEILKNSSLQFICFFGSLFLAGLFLTLISRWTQNVFQQFKFPKFGLYVFGVIGVPVHELCHAIFAKIFFHDVKKIKWFDPSGKGGAHGSVTHYYDDKSFFHRLGLFFIGMGPVLLAPIFLFAVYHYLVPGAAHFDLSNIRLAKSLEAFGATLINAKNWRSVWFYIFIYLTICITSQMELSSADIKIARGGIFPSYALFFIINALAYLFKFDLQSKFQHLFQSIFVLWIGFSTLAVIVAFLNFLVCLVSMSLLNKLMGEKIINPF
jgi:hypothetical protein